MGVNDVYDKAVTHTGVPVIQEQISERRGQRASIRTPNIYLYLRGSNLARQVISSKVNIHTQLHFGPLNSLAIERDEKGAKPPSIRRPTF